MRELCNGKHEHQVEEQFGIADAVMLVFAPDADEAARLGRFGHHSPIMQSCGRMSKLQE